MNNHLFYPILLLFCISLSGCWSFFFTDAKVLKPEEIRFGLTGAYIPWDSSDIHKPNTLSGIFTEFGIGHNIEVGMDITSDPELQLSCKGQLLQDQSIFPAIAFFFRASSIEEPSLIISKDISKHLTIYGGVSMWWGDSERKVYNVDIKEYENSNDFQRNFIGFKAMIARDNDDNEYELLIELINPALTVYREDGVVNPEVSSYYNTTQIGFALVVKGDPFNVIPTKKKSKMKTKPSNETINDKIYEEFDNFKEGTSPLPIRE